MSQRTDTPSIVLEAVRAACVNAALAAIRHVDLSGMLDAPADSAEGDENA